MSDSTHEDQDASPWTRPRFVIAAVVLALIAVLAVVLVVTRPGTGNGAAAPPSATPAPATQTPSATDTDTAASACGLEPGEQNVPVTAPPDTQWELVGTVAAPTAPDTIGPGVVEDGLRSCFAPSPLGALYAAVNFVASAGDPDLQARAVADLTTPGDGRDRALEQIGDTQSASSNRVQVVGFTFLTYTEESATTVDLAFRADNGGLAHLPLSMRWVEGDWKIALPATGEVFPGVGPIPDLTGYVPWGGA